MRREEEQIRLCLSKTQTKRTGEGGKNFKLLWSVKEGRERRGRGERERESRMRRSRANEGRGMATVEERKLHYT